MAHIINLLTVLSLLSTAACYNLNEYQTPSWTAQNLAGVFDLYSHAIHCDIHAANGTCRPCLTIGEMQSINKTVDRPLSSYKYAVYLLSVTLDTHKYCVNTTDRPGDYATMFEELGVTSNTSEDAFGKSIMTLLTRLNSSLSLTDGGSDHSTHDHSTHDHSTHNHSTHNHSTHDHSTHGNGTHSNSTYDHSTHDHSTHNHRSTHNHSTYDHSTHDNSTHNHSTDDHSDPHAGHDHANDHDNAHDHDHASNHAHDHAHDHNDAKCFGYDVLMRQLSMERSDVNPAECIAYFIVSHLLSGHKLQSDCPVSPTKSDVTAALLDSLSGDATSAVITYSDYEKLVDKVRPSAKAAAAGHEGHDHADHEGHDHSTDSQATQDDHSGHVHKRSVASEDISSTQLMDKCMAAEEITNIFGIAPGSNISRASLPEISLALVQQVAAGHCQNVAVPTKEKPEGPTDFQKWGVSTIAVAIISSLALLGGLLFPCMEHDFVQDVLTLFIGLGVGTMAGDALLHLIPQALGLHTHSAEGHGHSHGEGIVIEDYTWKMLTVSGAIYVFFLFEVMMAKFGHSHLGGEHGHSHGGSAKKENGKDTVSPSEIELYNSTESGLGESKEKTTKDSGSCLKLPTVAYMVILGDSLHNFVDGLAIGAAFTAGYQPGLALSIAILCHELPHELGDFAVLLSTGMSPKKVLLANFFCACCCFVGLYIGIPLSTDESSRQWIFGATAGMFLYISLVNFIPELAKRTSKNQCRLFFLQNAGLILGFASMFAIAVFEHHIKI